MSVGPLARSLAFAASVTTLAAIPPFLLSAQAVLMKEDLVFGEQELGIAVSAFFATAALTSMLLGRVIDDIGSRVTMVVAGCISAASCLCVGLLADSYAVLLWALVGAGVANAGLQITTNLRVASALPPERRGLGYGIKQSAIPFSILIGGIAVPAVAVTVGWRWTWLAVAVGSVLVVLAGLRMPQPSIATSPPAAGLLGPPRRALVITFVAMSMASMAVNSVGAFVPVWAFESGFSPSQAGVLVGAASAGSLVRRVTAGVAADRRESRHLPVVARDLLIGACGLVLVATGHPWALVVGTFVVFIFGWGWPGLLMFAVVRMARQRPGLASTSVQAGAFIGGALGPITFGYAVASAGYATAWAVATALMVSAALLLRLARRDFLADLHARPTLTPT